LHFHIFSILFVVILSAPSLYSNHDLIDTSKQQSLFDRIVENENIVFHIYKPIKEIEKNFNKDITTKGIINISYGSEKLSFSVKLEPGGKNRRMICTNPPIKIDLQKEELDKESLNKQCDKIKLVFQCASNKSKAESIKQEKLLYDIHALVTPFSRRAELVKVGVADKERQYDAILLEDNKDMDVRLDLKRIKTRIISTDVINREEYVKMCLFQFMIANADWSARMGHNTELYKRNADNSLIIVPYDFDYAGIINNDYASPPENLPIAHVTDRYFMDKSIQLGELKAAINYFIGIEADIHDQINNASYLTEGSRKRMNNFIKSFYSIIRNEKKVNQMLNK